MSAELTVFVVVCANGEHHNAREAHGDRELVTARARDIDDVNACGPHRVVPMVPAKEADRLRKRLAQADADRNRLTGYAGAANAHYDAGCADPGCRVCDLVGRYRTNLGEGVRRD